MAMDLVVGEIGMTVAQSLPEKNKQPSEKVMERVLVILALVAAFALGLVVGHIHLGELVVEIAERCSCDLCVGDI